jgi:hypothetical protein
MSFPMQNSRMSSAMALEMTCSGLIGDGFGECRPVFWISIEFFVWKLAFDDSFGENKRAMKKILRNTSNDI